MSIVNSPAFQGWGEEISTQGEAVYGLRRKKKAMNGLKEGSNFPLSPSPKGLGYRSENTRFAKLLF